MIQFSPWILLGFRELTDSYLVWKCFKRRFLFPFYKNLFLFLVLPISHVAYQANNILQHSYFGTSLNDSFLCISRRRKSINLFTIKAMWVINVCWAVHNCQLYVYSENAKSSSDIIVAWEHVKECSSEACSRCKPACHLLTPHLSFICPNGRAWIWKHNNCRHSESEREKCRWLLAVVHHWWHCLWCCEVGMNHCELCDYASSFQYYGVMKYKLLSAFADDSA